MRGRVTNVEAGQANANQAIAGLEAKQKEMEAEVAECKNLEPWVMFGLTGIAIESGCFLRNFNSRSRGCTTKFPEHRLM